MGLIAAVQMTSTHNLEENLAAVKAWVHQAAKVGAKLVVFPENVALMPLSESEKTTVAEKPAEGLIQKTFEELAKENNIWIVGGTIPMQSPDKNKVFSTTWVWNDQGKAIARYDKIHLFDVKVEPGVEEYLESNTVMPGTDWVAVDSPVGKLGLSVCYDLRFPELYRKLLEKGAELLLVPSAFTVPTGEAHWEVLLRARAIENGAYVVAPAQVGVHSNGRRTYGHSMIVDPWGKILAEEKTGEGLLVAEIDLNYLRQIRDKLPMVQHRKIY